MTQNIWGFPSNQSTTFNEALGYKKYVALITQTGTNDPVVNVLENNLGFTPVFIRFNPGVYVWEFPTGTLDKTKTTLNCNWYAGTSSYKNTVFCGYEGDWDTNIDAIVIQSFDDATQSDDIMGGGNSDFGGTLIEIRVYP